MHSAALLQIVLSGLGTGSIYSLIAIGFNITYKSTGALSFVQGEWVMLGGLVAATGVTHWHLPVWAACIAATLIVVALGFLSERIVIAPIRHPSPLKLTLVTVGLALACKGLAMLVLGRSPQGYPGLSGDAMVHFGGAAINRQTLWIIGVAVASMCAIHLFFNHTTTGIAMRAAAANRDAADLMGVRRGRMVSLSFALAAGFGGLAGTLITPLTLMSFDSGATIGFKAFSAAMLGGLGNLYGAGLGGLVLGLIEALAGGYLSSQFKDAVSFVILLLVLIVRPQGLFGKPDIVKI
ncbi:branched-chain amino acid ABC transporter permease [Paraburkholderia sp. RP-4-7]|jgi:branched-chain amino acid transport system permease protein|uniref:Branched-chain amino acid ABC transporter permease n=1 Tax=Paraburkholderia polaris TaxID=2728848 RepID=A0A848IBN3_9BURK|nr:branched-chain amino acid ABC transporter permease [Paraburkholderia polaris]NML97484.1 branched-chain amino acid ABC transporter permease [Paraburkholderia polaris]